MITEQKIKEIEGFVRDCQIMELDKALEVIRELQAKLNAAEYLDNALQNAKKDANAYRELYAEQLAENATLKTQLYRVRYTNWMRQFIIEHSNDSWNTADKIAKELQNDILGGGGGNN